ncbi:hypothetical protein FRC09_019766, partial [Ceratobasidium sp. 395]
MSSQLLNWLLAPLVNQPPPKTTSNSGPIAPLSFEINVDEPSPPPSEAGAEARQSADIDDDDAPPPFPLPNSIQR